MNRTRLARLLDGEVQDPDNAYTVGELVADVQAGVWKELGDDKVRVGPAAAGPPAGVHRPAEGRVRDRTSGAAAG